MIYKEFSRILKSEGLEPIPSVGVPLDVCRHEVLMRKVDNDVPEDTVIEEIQKGYLLNTFVLRTAKVVVSRNQYTNKKTFRIQKSKKRIKEVRIWQRLLV